MQSQQDKAADIELAIEHVKVTHSLIEKLIVGKDVLLVLAVDEDIAVKLREVGKWVLREATKGVVREGKQPAQDKISKVYFYNLNLEVVENQYFQVVCIDASPKQGVDDAKTKATFMLALSLIQKYSKAHEKTIKLFTAIQPQKSQKKYKQALKPVTDFLKQNQDLPTISADVQSKTFSICRLVDKKVIEEVFDLKKYENYKCQDFIRAWIAQEEVRKQVQNWRRFIQNFMISVITPFKDIINQVVALNAIARSQRKICEGFVNKIKQVLPGGIDELERVQALKNDEGIAYQWFTLQCLQIKQKYAKELRQKKNLIDILRRFFDEFFKQVDTLPSVTSLNLFYVRKMIFLLIEELSQLEAVSAEYFSPQVTAILAELAAKDGTDKDFEYQAVRFKVAERLAKMEVAKNKPSSYYILLTKLLNLTFQGLKLQNTAKKADLQAGRTRLRETIPLLQIEAIIQNNNTPKSQINGEIESMKKFLINFIRNSTNIRYDWAKMLNIFAKIGEKLKNYGLPQLAIEVFKKIRFETMIQETAKDLILKKGWMKKPQLSVFYNELSNYFQQIGNLQISLKYIEIAHENCPSDLSYLNKLIQKRRRFMSNEINKNEKTIVDKFNANNLEAYFCYQFPASFTDDLDNDDYSLVDTDGSFQMNQTEDLVDLLNFYQDF